MAGLGMTCIVISGGIDLSVGSVVALVTVVVTLGLKANHPPILAAFEGMMVGVMVGLWNGLIITRLKVVPFVVTLGSLLLTRGLAKALANEQKIDAPITWIGDIMTGLGKSEKWMLVPAGVWFTLICSVTISLILKRTVFGRQIFAIGANEAAATYAGLKVNRQRVLVYMLAGGLVGLAGILQFSRLGVGDPTVADGLELEVIAAVVIGGASLSGGRGSIAGTLLGALLMTTLHAGCSQMGLNNWVQQMVTGASIVAAVGLDYWRVSKSKSGH